MRGLKFFFIVGLVCIFIQGVSMLCVPALASENTGEIEAKITEVNIPGLIGAGPFQVSVTIETKEKNVIQKLTTFLKGIGGKVTEAPWSNLSIDVVLSGADGSSIIIGKRDSLEGAKTLFMVDASGLQGGHYKANLNLYSNKDGRKAKIHSLEFPVNIVRSLLVDREINVSWGSINLEPGDVYLITDLSRCTPSSLLSISDEEGKWSVYPYNWKGLDYGGIMLSTKGASGEITLPLNLNGRYSIYIGYESTSTSMLWRFSDEVEFRDIKFKDPVFTGKNEKGQILEIKEHFLDTAYLDNRSIVFKPGVSGWIGIAYIKFVAFNEDNIFNEDSGGNSKMVEYNKDGYGYSHLFGGGEPHIPSTWKMRLPDPVSLVHRDDGFSTYFSFRPYLSRGTLEKQCIDYLKDKKVTVKEWGLGPGSVFCFDTKVGEIFLDNVTTEQLKMFREGDRWVHENVMALIDSGNDPLEVAVERGHEIGLKVWARLEMNHEYPPASMDSWMWVGFVGSLNKNHPEYRIAPGVNLDYKYKEVRDFKIAILREAAKKGVDGISMDFVVYPPYFGNPLRDSGIMTQFVRDVRAMLDEVGEEQGRRIELIVRVPFNDYKQIGLDWKTWIKEGLIDIIIPSIRDAAAAFDVPIEEFIEAAAGTKTKVYGCIRPLVGNVTTDQQPGDAEKGLRRYDRPITDEMYNAKAMLLLRAGADGIQLALASANTWRTVYNDLGDTKAIQYKDKNYLVNRMNQLPAEFTPPKEPGLSTMKKVELRIADDIASAKNDGYDVDATLVFFSRSLSGNEELSIYINGNGPLKLIVESFDEDGNEGPIEARRSGDQSFIFDPDWWKKGMRQFIVPAEWWRLGTNNILIEYSGAPTPNTLNFRITDMDLILRYKKK